MNTFPSDRLGVGMIGPIPVFLDARLTVRATLFDEHGNPLPHNQLTIPDSGMLPNFSANATVLYMRADDGTVRELFPNVARTMIPVNGPKGGNAADVVAGGSLPARHRCRSDHLAPCGAGRASRGPSRTSGRQLVFA